MRFIRKYRAGTFVVRPEIRFREALSMGAGFTAQRGVRIKWQHAGRGLSPWEIDEAVRTFQFKGVAVGENPIHRLSFIDTDIEEHVQKWAELEEREGLEPGSIKKLAEERLLSCPSYGTDFFLSERPKAPAPYATYLEHRKVGGRRTVKQAIADITHAIASVGINPDAVVAYERDNHDQHTDAIVAAVQALGGNAETAELLAA